LERRIPHLLPELELALEERAVVLPARELHAVVTGVDRLHDGRAGLVAPAGATDDLGEELKRTLRRAEIRQAEADIRGHDADERDAREVVALRDHLRPHEDVDVSGAEAREDVGERALPADRVPIEPRDA